MRYLRLRTAGLAMIAVAGAVQTSVAQCPDGSAPPCRAQTVASAARRADPPLDDRTWIVVPFENLNANPEIDWLRAGSVNLLYLGLSRWSDIRVIDDERVADYLREVPGAADAQALSFNQGVAVAKRAGAGRLVMGDLLKLGSRTTVNVKVYDVRTGQRIRSVREETAIADSLMAMYGKLAQKVVNVAPPPGAGGAIVGTTSIVAYQEYMLGMQAMNRFDMDRAQSHLKRAIELDSTFALPHARMSVLLGWLTPNNPAIRMHAEAADRLSASLPPRERTLIAAGVAFSRREYVKACDQLRGLIKTDSTDTDAWYMLGDCLFHDNVLEPVPGDSTRVRWRASRNESVRAFRRTLELDPTYHLAYQHIVDAYNAQFVGGSHCVEGRCTNYVAVVRPSGDSLLLEPLAQPRDSTLLRAHLDDYRRTGARRVAADRAKDVAERWVAANPAEGRARQMYAGTLLALGRVAAADSNLRHAPAADTTAAGLNVLMARFEVTMKSWHGEDASRMYDSIRANATALAMSPTMRITSGAVVVLAAPVFGRAKDYDSLIAVGIRASGAGASRERLSRHVIRAMMGAPSDSFSVALREVYDELRTRSGPAAATRSLAALLGFAQRVARSEWPAIDTTSIEVRVAPMVAVLRGDTAALRRAARGLDSLSTAYFRMLVPDTGATISAAFAYLALRDSVAALQMTRRWLDSIASYSPLIVGQTGNTFAQALLPGAMLLHADVAAGLGSRDEARVWYDRFIAFWTRADPELQPVVERARRARAALGSP